MYGFYPEPQNWKLLFEYFSEALYVNVWASTLQAIHLSNHFIINAWE